jgi:hypothetical protein
MKNPKDMSPEEFVKWLHKKVSVSGGELPSNEEWELLLKNLEGAARWIYPWYASAPDDDDGGGGEDQIPPTSINWIRRLGERNLPVIH